MTAITTFRSFLGRLALTISFKTITVIDKLPMCFHTLHCVFYIIIAYIIDLELFVKPLRY